MFWGFSESFDLHEEYCNHSENVPNELNILLFGSGDPRHIVHTIAKSYKHSTNIHFYVVDGCIEITARYILLVSTALESEEMSLKFKTNLFMDLYGNSLIRPTSSSYLAGKAAALINMITDPDYLAEKAPIFNIDFLKYRERDCLQEIFNFYLPNKQHVFDIKGSWDSRVRKYLGVRYDYREGAFDWDLQMKLKSRGAQQICSQEYRHWRETGVAFVFPDYEQSLANKTLAAGLLKQGRTYKHRGYVGDINVGPFSAFGLSSSDTKMTASNHGINDFRSTDVTERNLLELFHEIQNKCEYTHADEYDRKFGAISLQIPAALDEILPENTAFEKLDKPLISTPNFKITFLSLEEILKIHENINLKSKFDIIFIGNQYFQFIKDVFVNICREGCIFLFETQARSVLKKDEVSDFLQKIRNFSKNQHLKEITKFNLNVDYSVVKFQFHEENENE